MGVQSASHPSQTPSTNLAIEDQRAGETRIEEKGSRGEDLSTGKLRPIPQRKYFHQNRLKKEKITLALECS